MHNDRVQNSSNENAFQLSDINSPGGKNVLRMYFSLFSLNSFLSLFIVGCDNNLWIDGCAQLDDQFFCCYCYMCFIPIKSIGSEIIIMPWFIFTHANTQMKRMWPQNHHHTHLTNQKLSGVFMCSCSSLYLFLLLLSVFREFYSSWVLFDIFK